MSADAVAGSRILRILQLFEEDSVWTVDAIARRLEASTSSIYRDVQELTRADFLSPVVGGGYVLGPAFVQFDRLARHGDPLIRLAAPRMRELLAATTQHAVVVLGRRYRNHVMCVHQEAGDAPHPASLYERGVAMPLFRGATSKAILAFLSVRTLERVYLENEEELRQASGTSWKAFRDELAAIRRAGVVVTRSEIAARRIGVAAPLFAGERVIGALSLISEQRHYRNGRFEEAVKSAAAGITAALSNEPTWVPRN